MRRWLQGRYLLAWLLLLTDLGFILLDIGYHRTPWITFHFYCIGTDRGYAEVFQYVKEFWLIILFVLLSFNTRFRIYVLWAGLFSYFLIDDALCIHESLGRIMADFFQFVPAFGLRAKDFGELIVSASVGLVFVLGMGRWYLHCHDSLHRKINDDLLKFLLALGFCGIVFDMLHLVLQKTSWEAPFSILEDGGEMVVMSLILWYVFRLHEDREAGRARA
ncbi:MAG: hypothetical protein U1D99_03070 [Candidatus Omnitrophota bacterium]|nr:hypothetical protein [Candidatus Omnitrophota bacterium]